MGIKGCATFGTTDNLSQDTVCLNIQKILIIFEGINTVTYEENNCGLTGRNVFGRDSGQRSVMQQVRKEQGAEHGIRHIH